MKRFHDLPEQIQDGIRRLHQDLSQLAIDPSITWREQDRCAELRDGLSYALQAHGQYPVVNLWETLMGVSQRPYGGHSNPTRQECAKTARQLLDEIESL